MRRQEEKRRRQRRRQAATIAVALVIALLGSVGVFALFTSGDDETDTAASPSVSPTESPSAEREPGVQTGTVDPEPGPEEIACRGELPMGASDPKPQFAAPAEVTRAGRTYTATLQTSCGDIVIELLAERAPETVNSFVFLARRGYFDGQRFHRLDTSIDVIQGGDPTATGTGGPGYSIPDELTGDESYDPGVIAMANSGPDTGGSQFFIVTGRDGRLLDDQGAWTIFGTVIEGLDVAGQIQGLPVQDPAAGLSGQQPTQAVYIERITISSGRATA